eukprot:gene9508-9672_t
MSSFGDRSPSRDYDRGRSHRDDDDYKGRGYDDDRQVDRPLDSAPKVFVGNLPYNITESDFRGHFESCGSITEVLMPRDHANDNRPKGYGFVTFEDFDSMDKAISKLDGSTLMGNVIKVDRATERRERPQRDNRDTRGSYDRRGGHDSRGGYDKGGYESRSNYNSRGGQDTRGTYQSRGGYQDSRGRGDDGGPKPRKPIGFRVRVAGLGPEIGWQLLKDFLRQAGDVSYASVDPDGLGVGEYPSLWECREAIEKLSGAALDHHIVKITPLNFDLATGNRLDQGGADNGAAHDSRGGGGGGYSSKPYDRPYSSKPSGSDDRGGGGRGYDRAGGGGDYRSPSNAAGGGQYNAGSSRYGGGVGTGASGSSRYGGSGPGPERSGGYRGGGDRHGPYDRH